jgi:hypothetical protein
MKRNSNPGTREALKMSIKPGEKSVASEQKREKERGVALSERDPGPRPGRRRRRERCTLCGERCSLLRCSAAPSSPARFIRGAAAAASLLTPRVELRRGVRYSTCHSTPRVMQGAASRSLAPVCMLRRSSPGRLCLVGRSRPDEKRSISLAV